MHTHAMIKRVLWALGEENRLLHASDLGLNDQDYTQLLETMRQTELITDTSASAKLAPNGEYIYKLSRIAGMNRLV